MWIKIMTNTNVNHTNTCNSTQSAKTFKFTTNKKIKYLRTNK